MKEEGLLYDVFKKIRNGDVEARWLLNQSSFNYEDSRAVSPTQKACIAFAIVVATNSSDPMHDGSEDLIAEALAARNLGELKEVVAKLRS